MPSTKTKQIQVLLIEDYPGHIEIMKRMFGKIENPAFNLKYSERLSTGLELFTKGKIDVVILDLTLPDSTGLDTFLRLHEQAPHTPIIVTSALDDEILAVRAVQAGAQDYLVKGKFDINLLKRSILYSIERKRVENFLEIQRNLGINLNGVRNLKKAFALVIDAATAIEDMDCGGIYLVNPSSGAIDLKYSKGLSAKFVKQVSHYEKDSANLRLIMKGKPAFIEHSKLEIPQHKAEHLEGLKAMAIIPMLYQGQVVACMNVASHTQKDISNSAQHVLEIIASQASIAIARLMIEEILKESEERYRLLVENVNLGITLIDSDYNIIMTNTATGQMFKKDASELVGKKCFREFEKRERNCAHCPGKEAMDSGLPQEVESEAVLDDGTRIPVFLRAFPIISPKGVSSGFIEIIEDITERKLAEKKLADYQKKLRSLASELSLTEERERRIIATDLHDHIGQSLAISRIKLKALQDSVSSVELAKPLEEVQELIEQAIDYTRTLMFKLSPPMLYDLGFESTVEWLTEQLEKKHGVSTFFKDDESPKPLEDEVRTLLFQAVRELLVNIAKHAQATLTKVSIQKDGKNIRIDIKDNGIGFDISKIGPHEDKTGGFGLFNIRERLDFIGGHFEIKSKPGKGTHVTITASLKNPKSPEHYVI